MSFSRFFAKKNDPPVSEALIGICEKKKKNTCKFHSGIIYDHSIIVSSLTHRKSAGKL